MAHDDGRRIRENRRLKYLPRMNKALTQRANRHRNDADRIVLDIQQNHNTVLTVHVAQVRPEQLCDVSRVRYLRPIVR